LRVGKEGVQKQLVAPIVPKAPPPASERLECGAIFSEEPQIQVVADRHLARLTQALDECSCCLLVDPPAVAPVPFEEQLL
jgi:hypothetical protein